MKNTIAAAFLMAFSVVGAQAQTTCSEFLTNEIMQDGSMLEGFAVSTGFPGINLAIEPKDSNGFKKIDIDLSGRTKKQVYVKGKQVDGQVKNKGFEYEVELIEKKGQLIEIKKSFPFGLFNSRPDQVVAFGRDAKGNCYPKSYREGSSLVFSADLCRDLHLILNKDENSKAMQCLVENQDVLTVLTESLAKHDKELKKKVNKNSRSTKTALGVSYSVINALENCAAHGLYPKVGDVLEGNYSKEEFLVTNDGLWTDVTEVQVVEATAKTSVEASAVQN